MPFMYQFWFCVVSFNIYWSQKFETQRVAESSDNGKKMHKPALSSSTISKECWPASWRYEQIFKTQLCLKGNEGDDVGLLVDHHRRACSVAQKKQGQKKRSIDTSTCVFVSLFLMRYTRCHSWQGNYSIAGTLTRTGWKLPSWLGPASSRSFSRSTPRVSRPPTTGPTSGTWKVSSICTATAVNYHQAVSVLQQVE